MVTGLTEKEYEASSVLEVLLAVKVTSPVNPLVGATVKVIPFAVPPEVVVAVAVDGDKVKSAAVAEVTSTVTAPLEPS